MKLHRLSFVAAALFLGIAFPVLAQPIGAPNSTATNMGTQTADHVAITGGSIAGVSLSGSSLLFTGTAPAPTGTGTPAIAAGSTDNAGEVTAGSSATSVVITFAVAKTNAPFCVVTSQTGGITSFAYAISTAAITVTQSATSGNKIDYHCVQH